MNTDNAKDAAAYVRVALDSVCELDYFKTYLEYTSQTETPPMVRVWCAVAGISASLGRHAFLDRGTLGELYPNLYIVVSGSAASRKSTAIKTMRQLLWNSGAMVRFGPDDTAGQYHGLIKSMKQIEAMLSARDLDMDSVQSAATTADAIAAAMHMHGNMGIELQDPEKEDASSDVISKQLGINWMVTDLHESDIHCVMSMPHELPSLLGTKNDTVGRFLNVAYDGTPYSYINKQGKTENIHSPLINLMASTQPEVLEATLSEQSMRDGFMSRTIFVHTSGRADSIPFPEYPDPKLEEYIRDTMRWASYEMAGSFKLADDAKAEFSRVYKKRLVYVEDSRFIKYNERRPEHWLKVAMAMAAADRSDTITLDHLRIADDLLKCAENTMHETLGFFGSSKESQTIAKIMEWFKAVARYEPVPQTKVLSEFQKEMDKGDIMNQLSWLTSLEMLSTVLIDGNTYYKLHDKEIAAMKAVAAVSKDTKGYL